MNIIPETIFHVGGFPITNTYLASLLALGVIAASVITFSKKIELIPSGYQNFIESIVEFLYNTAVETVGNEKRARVFFPLIATFFIYILVSNWLGLTPLFHGIGFSVDEGKEFIPLFRPVASDLNFTIVLALISTIATQYYAIKYLGIGEHLKKYFSWNPLFLFVGLLELTSVFTGIISFSFRLFGNIFAGDIVIAKFSGFLPIFLPIPFMGLEIIVGFVQATVFAMLSLAFTNMLSQKLH